MPDGQSLILHHFDASPFAEKIRLVLGLKGLAWHSVEIPMVMPKPALTALTGGYRKTPVLQIGADVYCDTRRIALELERRYPEPSLFPGAAGALGPLLGPWSDEHFFRAGAALSMGTNPDIPEPVLADRRSFFSFMDFSRLEEQLPHYFAQFQAQLQILNDVLERGGTFLAGDSPGWADIQAYFPVWMGRGNVAVMAGLLEPFGPLRRWEERVLAIGHGAPQPLDAEAALAVARGSSRVAEPILDPSAWPRDLAPGDRVSVAADDYGGDPVHGALLQLTRDSIAISREDARVGEVAVHFPRTGYRVTGAE